MAFYECTVAAIFATFTVAQAFAPNNYNEEGWKKASDFVAQYMDATVRPCQNFTGFVCAHFGNESDTTYQRYYVQKMSQLASDVNNAVKKIKADDTATPRYARVVKTFYDQCVSIQETSSVMQQLYPTVVDALGVEYPPFEDEKVNDNATDIWYLMGRMQRESGDFLAIEATFSYYKTSPTKSFAYPNLEPKLPQSYRTDFDTLRNYTIEVAAVLNKKLDLDRLNVLLEEATALYQDWYTNGSKHVSGQLMAYEYVKLTDVLPSVNWSAYWNGLLLPEITQQWPNAESNVVFIKDEPLLDGIAGIFSRHPARAVRMLMFNNMLKRLYDDYLGEYSSVKNILVFADNPSKWERCIDYVLRYMAAPAARIYFDHINEDILNWRFETDSIVRNIFSSMRLLLTTVTYLSPSSKEKINKKLDAITVTNAIPSWIIDDEEVLKQTGDFNETLPLFVNRLRQSRRLFAAEMRVLVDNGIKVDPPPTFKVNSNYQPGKKLITIFLGYNAPPFFSPKYPLSVKYGGLGFLIGHELMHAFDAEGIKAGYNDEEDWIEDDELEAYDKQKACLIRQYSQRCYQGLRACVSGKKTIQDNIADITGLKISFAAYHFAKAMNDDEPPMPRLANYTDEQVFFMTFARFYCTRNDPHMGYITKDDHTPDQARAEIALMNAPHFARSFGCAVGSRAAPVHPCQMWGEMQGTHW